MAREIDYDIYALEPSEEYFRKEKKSNFDNYTYCLPEESEPPHY